jgi:hypothetical protein
MPLRFPVRVILRRFLPREALEYFSEGAAGHPLMVVKLQSINQSINTFTNILPSQIILVF